MMLGCGLPELSGQKEDLFKESVSGDVNSVCQGHTGRILQHPMSVESELCKHNKLLFAWNQTCTCAHLYEMGTIGYYTNVYVNLSKKQETQQHNIEYLMCEDDADIVRKHTDNNASSVPSQN